MKNLCKRFNVTEEQIAEGVKIVAKGLREVVNPNVMMALATLLVYGDIDNSEIKKNGGITNANYNYN